MTVTDKLLRVFRVDQQINGLQTRLRVAERFLGEQVGQLEQIGSQRDSIAAQIKQSTAEAADAEGEAALLDGKIAELRERMNTANTNKEYKALLSEMNTYKERKGEFETKAVELLEKLEELKAREAELAGAASEREQVRGVAADDRSQRENEIREKLEALRAERETLVTDVPASILGTYTELVERLEEDAMAPIEVQDRKRHEFTCGACMMSLPVESMSALLSHGSLTLCVSCGCILYLDESTRESMAVTKK
jgi:predicted  nucleic acid-binding Zn-ribbon protein